MSEIALPRINSFAFAAQQANASLVEKPVFILNSTQITEIVAKTIAPLQDEIRDLEDIVANLEGKVSALEATQDSQAENELNMLRLINDLRKDHEPQPLQKDRGEILRALLVTNGGRMLATDARKKMHLSRQTFSELLSKAKDEIETRPYHLNKSWKVLVLR